MDKTLTLNYTIKPMSYEQINPQFAKMRCWVMALGKNRNYSYFSKESVEKALYSLYNIPVIAHIKKKEDGTGWYVGSHDKQIIIDDDGITVNDLTLPYGIVPESCNPEFIDIIESDGSTATYLAVDILLWVGRYPQILDAKSISDENVYYNESMEISVSAFENLKEDKKYSNITEFIFSALCLLGRDKDNPEYHSEPCFPSSRVEPYQYSFGDKFKEEFSLMLSELNKLSYNFENKKLLDKKEEEKNLNEKLELIKKYNLTVEQLDFNIDEISLEDLETKLKEFVEANKEPEKESKLGFSATYNQKREALRNALDSEVIRDSDGNVIEETYYWVVDASDEFCFVEKSHWNANGDYESKYGRFTYNFDESTMTATITSEFEEMFLIWLTAEQKAEIDSMNANYNQMKSEFDEYKNTYKTAETEVETLRNFQSQRLEQDRKEAEAVIFSEFDEELADIDEYKAIKDNSSKYELETLKEKCFAILGKSKRTFSFSKKSEKSSVILGVDRVSTEDDPYGGLIKSVNK
jgi:hypothetical protein